MTTNVKAKELNYDRYSKNKYDNDIVRSIPGHIELHNKLIELVKKFSKNNLVVKIADLGVGTGLTTEKILNLIPKSKAVAVDFSANMLKGAKRKLSKFDVEYIKGDYSKIKFGKNFDIVVAVIGIHHQTHPGKKKVFRKIFNSLRKGGIFIFGDLVTYRDPELAAFNEARHYHHLVENAQDEKSLKEWAYHHKCLNKLAPLEDQVQWLKEVGFRSVEVVFTKYNTALIYAKK
jgi:tRNA (cmo5U34)-methyltransferase